MTFTSSYTSFLHKTRYIVVIFWFAVLGVSIYFGPQLLTHTTMKFAAPDTFPSYNATKKMELDFPKYAHLTTNIVLFDLDKPNQVEKKKSMFLGNGTHDVLNDGVKKYSEDLLSWWNTIASDSPGLLMNFAGYFYFQSLGYNTIAASFVNGPYNNQTFIAMTINGTDVHDSGIFVKQLRAKMSEIDKHGYLDGFDTSVGLTGFPAMISDAQTVAQQDLEHMDIYVFPFALVVLALIVQSFRLMIIPPLTMVISALIAFTVVLPISYVLSVASFAPMIMMAAVVAMSIDYSLFLLTRFREEVRKGYTTYECVQIMLRTAGKTVLVSGSTIALAFFGLCFFSLDILKSIGLGTGIALAFTVLVNLSFTPALLLSFPSFFGVFQTWREVWDVVWCRGRHRDGDEVKEEGEGEGESKPVLDAVPHEDSHDAAVIDVDVETHVNVNISSVGEDEDERVPILKSSRSHSQRTAEYYDPDMSTHAPSKGNIQGEESEGEGEGESKGRIDEYELHQLRKKQVASPWHIIAAFVTKYWWLVIILILAVTSPLSYYALHFQVTMDFDQFIPREAASQVTYNTMKGGFPAGTLSPFYLEMSLDNVNGDGGPVLSDAFFENGGNFVKHLVSNLNGSVSVMDFNSVFWIPQQGALGMPLNYHLAQMLLSGTWGDEDMIRQYRYMWNEWVSTDNSSALLLIQADLDPFTQKSADWVSLIRNVIDDYVRIASLRGVKYYLNGGGALMKDMIEGVYVQFPLMVGITIGIIFAIAMGLFKSVLISVRQLISMAVTLSFVYGFAHLIFDLGIANGLVVVLSQYHLLYWITPPLAFTIVVGLGLDYDIFLLTRVVEYRENGFSNRYSIINGLYKSGGVITAAGLVMMIAFSGLFISRMMILNQFAFFLVFAVFIDTTIVRVLLVPAIMAMCGDWNWWPRKVPKPYRGDAYADELVLSE